MVYLTGVLELEPIVLGPSCPLTSKAWYKGADVFEEYEIVLAQLLEEP